jgi:hypothetical protein
MEKTCLHRFCGDCKDCKIDYEPITFNHPFNNYDCKNYCEIHFFTINVIEEEQEMMKLKVLGI